MNKQVLKVGTQDTVPYEDINKLISSVIKRTCYMMGLDPADVGDDMRGEAWAIVIKKAPCYERLGAKPTSYLMDWIRAYVYGYAKKELAYKNRSFQVTDDAMWDTISGSNNGEVHESRDTLSNIDPILMLAGYGYTDIEIGEILETTDITKRRLALQKDLVR